MQPTRAHRRSQNYHSDTQARNREFSPGSSSTTEHAATSNREEVNNTHYHDHIPKGSAHPSYPLGPQVHQLPRPWTSINPEVHRVIDNPTLNTDSTSNHQRPHSYPLSTQTARVTAYNPYHYQGHASNGTQRRLTVDTLREVNNSVEAATGMARWLEEGQRRASWDAVEYVRVVENEQTRSGRS